MKRCEVERRWKESGVQKAGGSWFFLTFKPPMPSTRKLPPEILT